MMKYHETEMCKTCVFIALCKGCGLKHCYGEDYVKQKG